MGDREGAGRRVLRRRRARASGARTIFAVGDEKQSIFSFQGAAPREFAAMRAHFERAHEHARARFRRDASSSTRSAPARTCSSAVDAVFCRRRPMPGLTADPEADRCTRRCREAAPGLVEIWEPVEAGRAQRHRAVGCAVRQPERARSARGEARASAIAEHRCATGGERQGRGCARRRAHPGAPARRAVRGDHPRAEERAASPVAGADRLVLTEHIAVMDLMALADALLLPAGRSGAGDRAEEPAVRLRRGRAVRARLGPQGQRCAAALRDAAARCSRRGSTRCANGARGCRRSPSTPACSAPAAAASSSWRGSAPRRPTRSTNFSISRSTTSARETPSLQGFVAWLRAAQAEVKRDMEIARDEVRVMTVHGAKGLEAPIVILADTTTPPAGPSSAAAAAAAAQAAPARRPLVWAGRKADDVGADAPRRAQARARRSARRIPAAALCGDDARRRPADRLRRRSASNKRPEGCWYELVARRARRPVRHRSRPTTATARCCAIARVRRTPRAAAPAAAAPAAAHHAAGLADADGSPLPVRAAPLKPSGFVDDPRSGWSCCGRARRGGARSLRGNIVHRLMQSLPDIPPERRADAARRYLARQNTDFTDAERDAIVEQVLAVARRSALCRAVCAGQPRRGSDRRPHRTADTRVRPGRPAGGHAATRS